MSRILDFEQGSPEWKAARAGKVTASKISDVMATLKGGGEAATRRDYRIQIISEILTGTPQDDTFTNEAMRWGTEQEPFGRAAYEIAHNVMVDQVGLVLHPTIDRAAASPDGFVEFNGLLEIKCPKTATHLEYLMDGVVPAKYKNQMLWQMACCEREWCDFVSFDPRMPAHLQLFKIRFERDDKRIAEIEQAVKAFLSEVDEVIAKLGTVAVS